MVDDVVTVPAALAVPLSLPLLGRSLEMAGANPNGIKPAASDGGSSEANAEAATAARGST